MKDDTEIVEQRMLEDLTKNIESRFKAPVK